MDFLYSDPNGNTAEELFAGLTFAKCPGVPESLQRFRSRLWHFARTGTIDPPVRRADGRRGTTGYYSPGTYQKVAAALAERHSKGLLRQTVPKDPAEGKSQRLVSLGVWLPSALGERVEALAMAGWSVSDQVLIGTRLLAAIPEHDQAALLAHHLAAGGKVQRRAPETRGRFVCAFELATHLLDRLRSLSVQTKEPEKALAWRGRFEFSVTVGRVRIRAVHVEEPDGSYERIEVQDA